MFTVLVIGKNRFCSSSSVFMGKNREDLIKQISYLRINAKLICLKIAISTIRKPTETSCDKKPAFRLLLNLRSSVYNVNKMSKKLELRLKTVDVTDLISLKTQLVFPTKRPSLAEPTYKNTIRHKTQNAPKLANVIKLAKKQEIVRYKVQQQIEEARNSPLRIQPKDNLKQFPKREKVIKNSNPYRYFQSSRSERVITDYRIPSEPMLNINFTKILKRNFAERIKSNSIAYKVYTDSDLPIEPRRGNPISRALQKKLQESFGSTLQPWRLNDQTPLGNTS